MKHIVLTKENRKKERKRKIKENPTYNQAETDKTARRNGQNYIIVRNVNTSISIIDRLNKHRIRKKYSCNKQNHELK